MFRQALLYNYSTEKLIYLATKVDNFTLEKFAPFVNGNNIKEIFNCDLCKIDFKFKCEIENCNRLATANIRKICDNSQIHLIKSDYLSVCSEHWVK